MGKPVTAAGQPGRSADPPGAIVSVEFEQDANKVARQLVFPVMVKAAGGGGGRGMRIAHGLQGREEMFARPAEANGGLRRYSVYIEKYLERPRHIEI